MPEAQAKQEEAKKAKEPSIMERLEEANKEMLKQAAENKKLRALLDKVLPPNMRADDGRPWQFEPKPRQVGAGKNQRFVPILCKDFVPSNGASRYCVRSNVCANARRVDKSLGCQGGADGQA